MNTDLNILARTLAERLTVKFCSHVEHGEARYMQSHCRECLEAMIREAIEKTLEEAERAITVTHIQLSENGTNSLQVIIARQTYLGAIRSLKQSNSGMEVRK